MEKRLFFLINMAQRQVFRFANNKSKELLDISVTQIGALLFVAKNEGCLQKELAQALGLNKPAITGLASRMEKNNLILRKPCPEDQRAMRLYLSEIGREKLPQIYAMNDQLAQILESDFSQEEIEIVIRFLNKLIAELE